MMYIGDNPIAKKSQNAIRVAFLKLLEIKPFNKISIKEINDSAQLARQTFYLLFSSKEEILDYHLDEIFKGFILEFNTRQNDSVEEVIAIFLEFFQKHQLLLKSLFDNKLHAMISSKFIQYFDLMIEEINVFKNDVTELEKKYYKSFISGAMVEVMSLWIQEDEVSIEEVSQLLKRIMFGDILEVS